MKTKLLFSHETTVIIPGTCCLQDIALGMAGMISGITLVYLTIKS